ncbi:hypothetical protein [Sutterella wadsworthensis]|uniref:hypothetical protein n=1 Tax=Sutterella wadsworthensis TaxID=40545 RepID=UPI003567BC59
MNWQAAGALALLAISFAAGYSVRDAKADAEMAELLRSEAVTRAEQGRKDYVKLVAAVDAAAAVRSELDSARADADRMRDAFDRRLRRAEAITQDADGAELAACTKLLRESVDLLSEGRKLALEIGAKHDALVSTHD